MRPFQRFMFALVSLYLVSCGGGGGGGDSGTGGTPPAPNPPPSATPPATPTGIALKSGNEKITVSWPSVTGATSYTLYMASESGIGVANHQNLASGMKHENVTSPYVHRGLANGTPYYFVLIAENIHGGSAPSSEATATPQLVTVSSITAGDAQSGVVQSTKTPAIWGFYFPFPVSDATDVRTLVLTRNKGAVVKHDDTLWIWGRNDYGEFGNDTVGSFSFETTTPARIERISDVKTICMNPVRVGAVKHDGSVWMWGYNDFGALGDGTTADRHIPQQVTGISNAVAISCGENHTMALTSDGSVWTWGANIVGQLGRSFSPSVPGQVPFVSNVTAIAAGRWFSVALQADGTVWTWGYNSFGQLGHDASTSMVPGLSQVVAIAVGDAFAAALKSDGTVWTWGQNTDGQLGDDSVTLRNRPVQVKNLTDAVAIAAGFSHMLALRQDGTVWAWGDNGAGQLGDGTVLNRYVPVQAQTALYLDN